jgi:hypothetical protein
MALIWARYIKNSSFYSVSKSTWSSYTVVCVEKLKTLVELTRPKVEESNTAAYIGNIVWADG